MSLLSSPCTIAVADVTDDAAYREFVGSIATGLAFVPECIAQEGTLGLKPESGDFLKWLATNQPHISVAVPPTSPKVVLRSADIWLPLIYLAGDTSAQVFLNMVASYLYERSKGLLKGETPKVHVSIVYEDRQAHKTKRLDFTGNADDLKKVIKKFDANNFFRDFT
jgi:hypothetical protein